MLGGTLINDMNTVEISFLRNSVLNSEHKIDQVRSEIQNIKNIIQSLSIRLNDLTALVDDVNVRIDCLNISNVNTLFEDYSEEGCTSNEEMGD